MSYGKAACIAVATIVLAGVVGAEDFEGVALHVEQTSESPGRLYLGEPLSLLVTTTNEGFESVKGLLSEGPFGAAIAFYARRDDGSQVRLDEPYDPYGVLGRVYGYQPPVVLRPGQSTKVRGRFVLDPRTGQLWLPVGGYDIFVVRRPSEHDRTLELRSNALRVVVSAPPERLRPAFQAYMSARLGLLVVDPAGRLREEPSVAVAAETFVREHGASLYGRQILASLLEGLRVRISTGQATSSEIEVYERTETNESIRRGVGLGPRR